MKLAKKENDQERQTAKHRHAKNDTAVGVIGAIHACLGTPCTHMRHSWFCFILLSVPLLLFVCFGQVLKSFSKLCPTNSLVNRGGQTMEVDSTELVMGDVVTLK